MARRRKGKGQTGEEILQQISESTSNTTIKSSVDQEIINIQKEQVEQQKATNESLEELIDLSKEEIRFQNRKLDQRQGKSSEPKFTEKYKIEDAPTKPSKANVADNEPVFNKDIDFKGMAIDAGNFIMAKAFPGLNAILERAEKNTKTLDEDAQSAKKTSRSNEMMSEKMAQDIENVHLEMKNMVAEQVKTNDLLSQILKADKTGGGEGGGSILGTLGDMLGMGGKGGAAQAGKVAPKSGFLGKVGGAIGKMGGLGRLAGGSVLGGVLEGVSEYSESGNAGRALSAGAGGLAGGAAGAVIGQMLIPIPGLGALIGGAVGSWLGGKGGKGLYDAMGSKSEQESRKENVTGSLSGPSGQQTPQQTATTQTQPTPGGFAPQQGAVGGPGGQQPQQATGDQTDQILATIKKRESGGNYGAQAKGSSASGAYQFTDSTWQTLSAKYGATGYKSAKDAPPEVQDKVAKAYVQEILQQNNGDVSKVPLVWYTGNAQGKMSDKALAANNGMTGEMYQSKWMADYNKMGGGTQVASAGPAGPSSAGVQMAGGTPGTTPGESVLGGQGPAGTFGGYGGQQGTPSEADVAGSKQGLSGMLPPSSLVSIGGNHKMTPSAAQAYGAMKNAAAQEGINWGITDSYRSYQEQVAVAQKKGLYSQGGLAAQPGKSNHGWGLAVDLNLDNKAETWLRQNARRFGFKNIPRERWHWEFAGGGDASSMASAGNQAQKAAKAGMEAEPVSGASPAVASSAPDSKIGQSAPTPGSAPRDSSGAPMDSAPSKGAQLAQASSRDVMDQRTAKESVVKNQSSVSVPGTSDKGSRNDFDNVGNVEPTDARTRFKELFNLPSVA